MLVTDSASVLDCNDINLFTVLDADKLIVSTCNRVVIAITGRVLAAKHCMIDVADFLAQHLEKEGSLSEDDEVLRLSITNLSLKFNTSFSLIIMTSIGRQIYYMNHTIEKEEKAYTIRQIRYGDMFALGTGGVLAYSAAMSGLDIKDAVKFAIRHDNFSKPPLCYASMDELTKYEEVCDV